MSAPSHTLCVMLWRSAAGVLATPVLLCQSAGAVARTSVAAAAGVMLVVQLLGLSGCKVAR